MVRGILRKIALGGFPNALRGLDPRKPKPYSQWKIARGLSRVSMTLKNINFAAIDVETANPDYSSVCQVGIAVARGGEIAEVWSELVDPRTWFHWMNVKIHGIDAPDVVGKPTFGEIYPEIAKRTAGVPIVSHSHFDKSAISQACALHRLPMLPNDWKDSVEIAKRAWPRLENYKLRTVADHLGIRFEHHDAGEDAEASAKLVLRACAVLGAGAVYNWLRR